LSQIEQVIKQMSSAVSYPEIVIMDCIIRGVARIETLDKLRSNKHMVGFVEATQENLAKETSTSEWKEWQMLLRVSETWGSDIVKDYYPVLKDKAKQLVKDILEQKKAPEQSHILTMFFALQYLLDIETDNNLVTGNNDIFAIQYIPLILERFQKHQDDIMWDGDLRSMSTLTSSVIALFVTLTTKWSKIIGYETFLSFTRQTHVDRF